jgi:uncharacterized protein
VKWMNNIAQLFGFIVPVVLFALVFGMRDVSRLMLRKPNFYLFTGALWVMGATGVITALGWLNTLLIPQGSGLEQLLRPQEESAAHLTQLILSATGPWAICSTVITVAIVPALAEEFVFRGVVQPLIARSTQRIHLSVWLTAALFSFIHFQFYGFLPRLVLGAMLGYLVIWSGTIWTSVVAHATNNLMAVVAYYVANQTPEALTNESPEWMSTALSISVTCALGWWLYKQSKWPWIGFDYLGITSPSAPAPSSNPQGS